MKRCTKCGVEKPFDQFYRHRLGRNGLDPSCKACKGDAQRAYIARRRRERPTVVQEWKNGLAKLSTEQRDEIRRRYVDGGLTLVDLAKEYDVVPTTIANVVRGLPRNLRCPHCPAKFARPVELSGHIGSRHARWIERRCISKTCAKCGIEKPVEEFHRAKDTTFGYGFAPRCKECTHADYLANRAKSKARERERRYGLTHEQYEAILARQGWACVLCRSKKRLVIDHDHGSGAVRGVLCSNCNTAIGLLADDPARALAVAAYLRGEHVGRLL